MDISDGIESEVPLVVPEHLVFAVEEWIAEMIKRACDAHGSPEDRSAVIRAVHLHDAFVAGSLTPAQIAELAGGAAGWLEPQWPKSLGDADEVTRLAGVTRELLELRDHALTVAANSTNIGRVVIVDPGLREILRSQTLLVLEFSHERFEDVEDLKPVELLATGSIFRDAIAVLDTIGWLPTAQTTTIEVPITAGHLAQLERLRADLAMSILASLDSRDDLTAPEDIARLDGALAADRLIAQGLLQIVRTGMPRGRKLCDRSSTS